MPVNIRNYEQIMQSIGSDVTLVAVSKTKPVSDIQELYELGHYDFGENFVQEMAEKHALLPADIRWHFIGHLQTNKVKAIVPFVYMIHGVDSLRLLREIDKQASKHNRNVNCLLQVHIAEEETKFGFSENDLMEIVESIHKLQLMDELQYVTVRGLMGMASFTNDPEKIKKEFLYLRLLFDEVNEKRTPELRFDTLSMGMSSDYRIALDAGANMIRIGSLIFGERPASLNV